MADKETLIADIMGIVQRVLFPEGYKLTSYERTQLVLELTRTLQNYEEVTDA